MLKVREIMSTDLVTVTPETTVREAMELLGMKHVSGAPVISGEALVGVVTAGDLLTFASALSGVPTERPEEGEWAPWEEEPAVAAEVEKADESPSAYFADLWDDAGADVTSRLASVEGPEWNTLEEHTVSEVMTHAPLVTVTPNSEVDAAANLMQEKRIHRVLVTEDDRLIGIVSALDVAKAAADHRLTTRTYVFNREPDSREVDAE